MYDRRSVTNIKSERKIKVEQAEAKTRWAAVVNEVKQPRVRGLLLHHTPICVFQRYERCMQHLRDQDEQGMGDNTCIGTWFNYQYCLTDLYAR